MKLLNYPKVLVISGSDFFIDENQTSITLRCFFGEWPIDRIAILVCKDFNVERKLFSNKNIFYLSIKDVKLLNLFLKEKRKPVSYGDNSLPVIPKDSGLFYKLKRTFKLFLADTASLFTYQFSFSLYNYIDQFKPDVVYTTLESTRMLLLSQEIGKKFKIRVFPHFMDDFPSTNYRSLLSIVYRGYFQNKIKEIIIQSPACFCISDAMCDVYRKRYNYSEFFPLMNSVENYNERTNIKGSSLTKSKIIITYAGGLHLNRYETLMKFCQHLTNFPDILYELKIYTSERDWAFYKDKFTQFKDVSYGGFLKKCEIMSVICNSDILLHVESFDPFIQNYTMYSISTKIPEYLSSGNIIVAIGPKNIASISYLSINKVAYIIDNMNDSILFNDVIYKVLYSDNKELKANAKNLFLQKHLKSSNIDLLIRVFSINK